MNRIISRILATTLFLITIPLARAEEATNPAAAVVKKHIMLTPGEIVWGECPPIIPPGAKCATIEGDPKVPNVLFTIRAKLPNRYKIPPHFHSADEHVTVISGTFKMGLGEKFDEKSLKPMTAGSFMVMPKGAPHFALTRGETVVQVFAIGPLDFTYINPKDDPRNH